MCLRRCAVVGSQPLHFRILRETEAMLTEKAWEKPHFCIAADLLFTLDSHLASDMRTSLSSQLLLICEDFLKIVSNL